LKELYHALIREIVIFAKRSIEIAKESTNREVKSWRPLLKTDEMEDFCCPGCGINHETRDFARAVILHTLAHAEVDNRYFEMLKENNSITPDVFDEFSKSNQEVVESKRNDEVDQPTEEPDF